MHVIGECQKFLGRNVNADAIHCFPLDGLQLLDQACAEYVQAADQRRVTFKIQKPRLLAQVLAYTTELSRLLKDAAENSALTIDVEDVSNTSTFRFSNAGFGIPRKRLQEILTGPEPPDSEEFQVLREAASWVRNWDGSFEISSDVGKGYSVTLQLRQFPVVNFLPTGQA